MKQIIYMLLFGLVLIVGCKRDPVPKDAIKTDKYIDILVDVHIAEALYAERTKIKIDSLQSGPLYLSVLEKHGVTEEEMLHTTMYYSRNQKEYKKIFTEVLDKLSIRLEELEQQEELNVDAVNAPNARVKRLKSNEPKVKED